LRHKLWAVRQDVLGLWFAARAVRRFKYRTASRPHHLPAELVVSVTSYPLRFNSLHLTLACLLDQTVKPDRLVLWIASSDIGALPERVRRLRDSGVDIRTCDDLRSFKKLVPALEAYPNAFIATADDDIYYSVNWLKDLVDGTERGVIVCHRAHRLKRLSSNRIAPYLQWAFDAEGTEARQSSPDLVPIGVGGVLYPPLSLDPRVTDRRLFQRLCPAGDDLWFYWCARMAGTQFKKVGRKTLLVFWPRTQESRLWDANAAGGNDQMIAALEAEFGCVP
jgi:hypothetical protein